MESGSLRTGVVGQMAVLLSLLVSLRVVLFLLGEVALIACLVDTGAADAGLT